MADHGDLARFRYSAVHQRGSRAHDKSPEVLILHPDYEGYLHGLNWGLMTEPQKNVIRMILDVNFEVKHKQALTRQDPTLVQAYDAVISKASITEISRAEQFYHQVIRPLLGAGNLSASGVAWEPYRKYRLDRISDIHVTVPAAVMMGETPGDSQSLMGKLFRKIRGTRGKQLAPNFRRK